MGIVLTFTVCNEPKILRMKVGNHRLNNYVIKRISINFKNAKENTKIQLQIMMNSLITSPEMENPKNKYLIRLQFTEFWFQLL